MAKAVSSLWEIAGLVAHACTGWASNFRSLASYVKKIIVSHSLALPALVCCCRAYDRDELCPDNLLRSTP